MSMRAAIKSYIQAHPGQHFREITRGLGLSKRAEITTAGAQLSHLVKVNQLRAEGLGSRPNGAKYFPTPTTKTSAPPRMTKEQSEQKRLAREQRRNERRRAERKAKLKTSTPARTLTQPQREAFYGTDLPAPAPLPASAPAPRVGITISRKPLAVAKTRFNASAEPETVEEWMRRTGKQPERLPPHACGRSVLRFDHSDNTVPTGRRRPALRVRGAHRT